MAISYGLKLWTTNTNWFAQAKQLCADGAFHVIELYVVPGTTMAQLEPLRGAPIRIHAPHENHGLNLFTLTDRQRQQFHNEVSEAATVLASPTIVVHAGVGQDEQLFAKQLARLDDPRIIIENMPLVALDQSTCFGYSIEQLTFIRQSLHRELCLDLGHAVKSAASQGQEYQTFIQDIVTNLQPTYFHLSDGDVGTEVDEHLNLGTGTYDLPWMKQLIVTVATKRDVVVIFEVPKNNVDLGNDVANVQYWQGLP